MSTKTTTTQTPSFAPAGMGTYNALQPQIGSSLGYYMGTSPMQTPFFQAAFGAGTKQAGQLGAGNVGNIMQNAAAGGWGGRLQPFQQNLLQTAGMQNSALRQQAFWNALQQATGLQMQATGLASGYRPLETGMTTTQQKSGLGTWLPQIASLGLGALTGGLFGGGGGGGGDMATPSIGWQGATPMLGGSVYASGGFPSLTMPGVSDWMMQDPAAWSALGGGSMPGGGGFTWPGGMIG